jgi:hypothetical protein
MAKVFHAGPVTGRAVGDPQLPPNVMKRELIDKP